MHSIISCILSTLQTIIDYIRVIAAPVSTSIRILFPSSSRIPSIKLTDGSELLIPVGIGFFRGKQNIINTNKNCIPMWFVNVCTNKMCYISSFTGIIDRIGLNKMSIRDNIRATVRICIDKSLIYRLTLPPLSGEDMIPKFLPK